MATVAGSKRLLDISGNNVSTAVSLTASGTLLDTNGAAGASNQVLSSTGSGVDWVDASSVIGGPYLPLSAGASYPLTGRLDVTSTGGTGIRVTTGANSEGYLIFGDADDNSMAGIAYNNSTNKLSIDSNNSERITIDSDGNVGIGTTSPSEKLNVSGNILATGAIKGSSLYTNNVDQNNTGRYGNLRSEVGFSRSPISGNPEQWFKVVELNGSPKRIKFSIIATGDNTNSYDNFLISTSGYGMPMHIEKLPGGRYNTSKLLSVAVINPNNGGSVEIWIKLGPVYSGTGATYVACTSDVLASATILASATTTAPTITGNDTQLNISNDNRNYATIQTSRGATFGSKVGIGTNSPAAMLTVEGDTTITDNVGIGTTNPTAKLHVAGQTHFQLNTGTGESTTWKNATSGGEIKLGFQINGTDGMHHRSYIKSKIDTNGTYGGQLQFLVRQHSTATDLEVMTLRSSGNVGIGTTSPSDKLDVSGRVVADAFRTDVNTGHYSVISRSSAGNPPLYVQSADSSTDQPIAKFFYGNANPGQGSLVLNVGKDKSYFTNTNVGIGTTSPQVKLDVRSTSSNYVATFKHSTATGYAPGSILLEAGQGSSRGQGIYHYNNVADENWFTGVPYSVNSKKWIVANKYSTVQAVDTAQLTYALMTIDSDTGNVGIGTTDPNKKLEVSAATDTTISIASSDTTINVDQNIGILEFASNNESSLSQAYTPFSKIKTISEAAVLGTGTVNGAITFETARGNVISEHMRIDSSGNVGVGTTNPGSKLEVTGDTANALLTLKSENGGSNDAFMRFYNEGAGSSYSVGLDSSDAKFKIAYGTDGDSLTTGTKLVMDTSGNVGIGTTSPATKLHVAGEIRAYDSGNTYYANLTANSSWGYFNTNAARVYINKEVQVDTGLIGSYNEALQLRTSGTTRMYINNSTGNVGIGTTSPQAGKRLDVRSDANIAGSNAVAGYGYNDTGAGILAQGYATSGTGTNHGIIALSTGSRTGGTNVGGHFSATGAANNYALTTGTGNVGIGKTDPSNKLEIVGPNAVRIHDGTDQGSIFFRGDRDDVYIRESNYQLLFGAPSGMVFELDTNSNNGDFFNVTHRGSSRFRINGETGHVGIGTTSPDTLLQTTNTADGTDYISYEIGNTAVNASNKGGFAIYELGTKQVTLEYYRDGSAITNLSTPYIFTIDTNSQERMRITNAGNVGIGTTSPGEKLEVLGNVKATNFILSSDASLKEDVNKLNVKVEAKWKSYKFKDEDEVRYGVIAQELEETNPELVKTDDKGLKSVKYIDLLIAKIAELEARLEKAGL